MSILSTNQRLISLGQDYSAGENIGINNHVISSRNWSPDITYAAESAFQRATGYTDTQISALSSEVSSEVSQLGSDIQYISGVALTSHQSLEGYLTKASGDEYYQPIGSYATVSQLESTSGEIVNLIPTDYVSNETLEQTSGNIVNLIPDTSEFITNASAEQTYQPIGNYLSSNALEGYATQDWVNEQGYITGVDLSNYYTKNETSGADELEQAFANIPLGDEEVNELVHSNSAEWNNVSSKLDESVFQETSGLFLTAVPQEYITESDIPNFISAKLDSTAFSTVSGDFLTNDDLNGYATESFVENVSGDITALIPTDYATTTQINELSGAIDYVSANAGDQEVHNIVHTNSATWDSVTNKLDTTAFSDVSGTFLTAHQSLDGYATETLVEETSGAITSLIPTDYYPDTNPSGFISGVDLSPYQTIEGMTAYQPVGDYATTADLATKQDTLTFGYDEQDRISAINSSALAGGTDLEFGYTDTDTISSINNSALTDVNLNNIVQTNSGSWGGSALPISAGPGIKVNLVDNTLVFSNDETVLFNGDLTANSSATLSESWLNFDRIKVFGYSQPGGSMNAEAQVSDISGNYLDGVLVADVNLATVASWVHRDNFNIVASMPIVFINNTTISAMNGRLMGYWNGEWQTSFNEQRGHCTKVIGINRKQ